MSLLPIIYTSLLIFSILFILVLVSSYISYRIKQSNKLIAATNSGSFKLANQTTPQFSSKDYKKIIEERIKKDYLLQNQNRVREKQVSYPRTKSVYYREEREVGNGDKRIDVIYKDRSSYQNDHTSQKNRRLSIIDSRELLPQARQYSGNYSQSSYKSYTESVVDTDLLKYYDDF